MSRKVYSTERTGKQWKFAKAVGLVAFVVGLVMVFGTKTPDARMTGAVLLGGGAILRLCGFFGAWWHHD